MFGRSNVLFFLLAVISPVYSAACNDADEKKINVCMKTYQTAIAMVPNTDDTEAKSQEWWEIQKKFYNCMKQYKCGDFYDKPSSLEGFLIMGFTTSVDNSAIAKCVNQRDAPCYKKLMDQYKEFLENGVHNAGDKKKYCELLKGAPSCFVSMLTKTKDCGDKEIKNFKKKFDELYKTVKCQ